MRKIDISEWAYKALQKEARPFEEPSPNAVIERLLRERSGTGDSSNGQSSRGNTSHKTPGGRLKRGLLLPQHEYEIPILEALDELGGRANIGNVLERVYDKLQNRLNEHDLASIGGGWVKWQNRAQFARFDLVQTGDLKKGSPRGIWEISDQGRTRLRKVRATQA